MKNIQFKLGDIVLVKSDTMELIVPVTEPATFVELLDGDKGVISDILEDGVTVRFNNICCDFAFDEFDDGFLELIKPRQVIMRVVK